MQKSKQEINRQLLHTSSVVSDIKQKSFKIPKIQNKINEEIALFCNLTATPSIA